MCYCTRTWMEARSCSAVARAAVSFCTRASTWNKRGEERDFRALKTKQKGFQGNSTGVSKGPLIFNRGFNKVLKIQQGFSKGSLKINRGFKRALETIHRRGSPPP